MAKLTTQQVTGYILAYLGAPGLHVELDGSQLQVAIEDAVTVYSRYAPLIIPTIKSAIPGSQKVKVTPVTLGSVVQKVLGIHDVQPQRPGMGAAQVDDIDIFRTPVMIDYTRNFNVVDYSMLLTHYESFIHEFGTEFDWEEYEDPTTEEWYVIFSPPLATALSLSVHPAVMWSIENIPYKDHDWIKKYSLECAREMLGTMRSKFASLPGALGSVEMNGAQLLEVATTKKAELEAEIQGRNPVTPLILQG